MKIWKCKHDVNVEAIENDRVILLALFSLGGVLVFMGLAYYVTDGKTKQGFFIGPSYAGLWLPMGGKEAKVQRKA